MHSVIMLRITTVSNYDVGMMSSDGGAGVWICTGDESAAGAVLVRDDGGMSSYVVSIRQVEAFYAYCRFLLFHCPLYVQKSLDGVHFGLRV